MRRGRRTRDPCTHGNRGSCKPCPRNAPRRLPRWGRACPGRSQSAWSRARRRSSSSCSWHQRSSQNREPVSRDGRPGPPPRTHAASAAAAKSVDGPPSRDTTEPYFARRARAQAFCWTLPPAASSSNRAALRGTNGVGSAARPAMRSAATCVAIRAKTGLVRSSGWRTASWAYAGGACWRLGHARSRRFYPARDPRVADELRAEDCWGGENEGEMGVSWGMVWGSCWFGAWVFSCGWVWGVAWVG